MNFLFIILCLVVLYITIKSLNAEKKNDQFLSPKEARKQEIEQFSKMVKELEECINMNYHGYLLYILQNISQWRVSDKRIHNSFPIYIYKIGKEIFVQYVGNDDNEISAAHRFIKFLKSNIVTEDRLKKEFFMGQVLSEKVKKGDAILCGYELGQNYNKKIVATVEKVESMGVLAITADRSPCEIFNNNNWNLLEFCYINKIQDGYWFYQPKNRVSKQIVMAGDKFEYSDIVLFIRDEQGGLRDKPSEPRRYMIKSISESQVKYVSLNGEKEYYVTADKFYKMTEDWRCFRWE